MPNVRRRLTELVAIAVAYYLVGRLGLLLAIPPGFATAVWPASGIALAGTLLFGYRVSLGVLLGAFLVNLSPALESADTDALLQPIGLAASIGLGASLQAIVGAFLINRYVEHPTAFIETRDILKFLLFGGLISCLINATWGVTTLLAAGVVQPGESLFHWWTWWIGDAIGAVTFTPVIILCAAKRPLVSRYRKISVSLPLCLVFTLVVISFINIDKWEQNQNRLAFKHHTGELAQQLKEHFDTYIDVLYSVQNIYASSVVITRQQFKIFVSRWFSLRPGIRTVAWNPHVLDAERMTLEHAARRDGVSNFEIVEQNAQGQLVRAARRAEYIPVYYLESVRGTKRALGFDIASEPTRREALNRARDTGRPTATDRLTLLQDVEPAIVMFFPIYKAGRAPINLLERRLNLQGYVSGAFRVADVVKTALEKQDTNKLEIRIYDTRGGGTKRLLYEHRASAENIKGQPVEQTRTKIAAELNQTIPLDVADRRWLIEFAPTKEYLAAAQGWGAWCVLAGGLFFTGFLGAVLLIVTGHSAKLRSMNTDLEKEIAERKLAHDKVTKYGVIVDSLDEAIIGSTWDGIITSWNKGAEIMYGYTAEEIYGRSITVLFPPHRCEEFSRLRQELETGQPVAQYETFRLRKDRTEIPVSLTLSLMKDAAGTITGVASISSNITERKRAEAKLQQHRDAVANRLHDSVIQSLTAISLQLKMAQNLLTPHPPRALQHLAKIEGVLSEEQQNLRFFVNELKGVQLAKPVNESDAISVLDKLSQRLERQWNVRIEISAEPGVWIPAYVVGNLLFLIQEGVSNAVRHGHASNVQIKISHKRENLVVRIIDDGCGFPFWHNDNEVTPTEAGPKTLQNRVSSLGGLLSIRSTDKGVCLEIMLPLSRHGDSDADKTGYLG